MWRFLYHFLLAWLGNLLYGYPSKKLFVLGVTGTKGKSTVLELIDAILEAAGEKTALLSSLRIKVGADSEKNLTGNTMPGRFFIQRFLRQAVSENCRYALIEVTSQGVAQHRHRFIDWNAGLVTNLTPEHIEAHGSFENYCRAKVNFFKAVAGSKKPEKFFFVNEGIAHQDDFLRAAEGRGRVIVFSRDDFVKNYLGRSYDLASSRHQRLISEWLLAEFNLENAAAATAFSSAIGVDWEIIKEVFENFKGVAGRMEFVQQNPFKVVIDYAHTPESLWKVYRHLLSKKSKKGKLICVLGAAGGGRDKWKRPVMGKIAAEYCDQAVLTNEDPYNENPDSILNEIESGFSPMTKYRKILDRKEAIAKAINSARKGDVVIITGKGSESWIHLEGGKKMPWDERKIVEEILR